MLAARFIPQATITYACIQSICAEIFLLPGTHIKKRIEVKIYPKTQSDRIDKNTTHHFGTWLPKKRELVCLFRHEGLTLVYIISQNQFYKGNPSVLISPECPDGTVFLGHFTFDEEGDDDSNLGHRTQRILIFDILFLSHKNMDNMDPVDRYSYLQRFHDVFSKPTCVVQWVGDCRNLVDELKTKKFKAPHSIESVIKLTTNTCHILTFANIDM